MRKFIVFIAMMFFAGTAGNLFAGDILRKPKAAPNLIGGAQLTQGDQAQVADKLAGGSEINTGDDKAPLDHKVQLDHKGQNVGKGQKGFHKGEKGFLKLDIKKGEQSKKGFLKGEKGKPNEIDDEVTWSKNKGLDAKNKQGKGFIKFDGTGKAQGAGNQMPAVK